MYAVIDNNKKYNRVFNVGIYLRLSEEDDERGNSQSSQSITNQKELLTGFVTQNEWNLTDIYCDDGYTGTNFNRPDFQRLLNDIERKRINAVITKDLSRLGRDYIETGYYLERYFPEHNVRYIALNDGIDTFSKNSNNDMSPFKAVMNDMYSRDISKKIKSSLDIKKKTGKFIGAFAPYGYFKCPGDKNKLIIDNETAPVIRRIFDLYIGGFGYNHIASTLQKDNVMSPSAYKSLSTNYRNVRAKHNEWTPETIKSILINPTYAGNLTQNRCEKLNYKSKKLINMPRSEWITVDDTHEAIISKDTYDLAQKLMSRKTSTDYTSKKAEHLLAGLIYCGDCGGRMTFSKTCEDRMYCICMNHKRFNDCSRHSVLESELEACVLDNMKEISESSCDRAKLLKIAQYKLGMYYRKVNQNVSENQNISENQNEIKNKEKRLEEIKVIIKNLYEDKLKGVLQECDFIYLCKDYNMERERLKSRLEKLVDDKSRQGKALDETEKYIKLVEEFAGFKKVDKTTLVRLINKIEVFEDRNIKINYRFKRPN